jgi:GAF domain-containing protein/HAMP domain-containing protein
MAGESVGTSAERPSPMAEGSAQESMEVQRRAARFRRLALILAAAAVLTIGLYVVLFLNTRVWQILAEAGFLAVALICAAAGYWLAGRERLDAAGYLALIGVLIAYGGNELVFAGATVYILVGGVLIVLLVGNIVLPGKWPVWLAFAAVYVVYVLAVSQLEPVQRYDIANSMLVRIYIPGISAVLVLVVLFQIVRAYGRIGTIGVRLVLTSVSLVLLVAAAVGGGSIWLGLENAREQAFRELDAVATLKYQQIDRWVSDLQLDLDALFVEAYELERVHAVLLADEQSDLQELRPTLRSAIQRRIGRAERLAEVFLVNLDGNVVLSTNPNREGENEGTREFYRQGLELRYVHPPTYDPLTDKLSIFVAKPVTTVEGEVLGVQVGRADLFRLNYIMGAGTRLGGTEETYLIDLDRRPLTYLKHALDGERMGSELALAATTERDKGRGEHDSYSNIPVIGVYQWIPDLEVALLAEQEQSEVAEGAQQSVMLNAGVVAVSVLIAVGASVLAAQGISGPLAELSRTATQIAAGDLSLTADTDRRDEIGTLARSFNSMTGQLRGLVGRLEQSVAEATRDLETAAEVSRATTLVLDPDALQHQVVDMIQERFDLYYVGLFLLDEARQYAVLRAGTGEFGRAMLAREHRLEVGGDSMIGRCVAENEVVALQSIGEAVARFDNPLLPDTRSELALPMRARGRVIGAMTVQSDQESAFDEQYISTLQTVADQVAAAIDNARNFADVQAALAQAQEVQRRYLGQAWSEYVRRRPVSGYEYEPRGSTERPMRPLGRELLPEIRRALSERQDGQDDLLVVPVVQGDRVVATLGFHKGEREWGAQDIALVEAVAEQLGLAAETQRLLEVTQSRAAREQLTLRIAEQVRGALDIEDILRVASQSLGRELDASEVVVRLGTENTLLGEDRS